MVKDDMPKLVPPREANGVGVEGSYDHNALLLNIQDSCNDASIRSAYVAELVIGITAKSCGDIDLKYVKPRLDRKSTRLNSSHQIISYAVFCLKKKKQKHTSHYRLSHDV